MIKGVTHAHLGPVWYHSEPSGVPYSPNQFLGLDFFCHFLQQDGSNVFRSYDESYHVIGLNMSDSLVDHQSPLGVVHKLRLHEVVGR